MTISARHRPRGRLRSSDGSRRTVTGTARELGARILTTAYRRMVFMAYSVEEVLRVLKPGGTLVLTLDNAANPVIALRNARASMSSRPQRSCTHRESSRFALASRALECALSGA